VTVASSPRSQIAVWTAKAAVGGKRYVCAMTAHPVEPVPDADPDEAAVAATALREYREWVAKGRPGVVSHEEAIADLLGDAQ
jgi:hypothetical protein